MSGAVRDENQQQKIMIFNNLIITQIIGQVPVKQRNYIISKKSLSLSLGGGKNEVQDRTIQDQIIDRRCVPIQNLQQDQATFDSILLGCQGVTKVQ